MLGKTAKPSFMRIFITGATGFIGKHTIGKFNTKEHSILALVRDESDCECLNCEGAHLLKGNLGLFSPLKSTIKSFGPEVVIHLAWEGIPDYSEKISRINLENSIRLIDFLCDETHCRKIVISGSCFEYGKNSGICKETDQTNINSFFSWAKHALYNYAALKCEKVGVDLIWFRVFYVYGPHQRKKSLIPTLVSSFKNGISPRITNALNKNDFIYVEDVAEAFYLAVVKKIKPGIYNLGNGNSISVYEVCNILEKRIIGTIEMSEQIKNNCKVSQEVNFWADMTKTKNMLNWSPKISFEHGIDRYIKF